MQHGRYDSYFLLISRGKITDKLLLPQYFSVHKTFESGQTFIHLLFFQSIHFADEIEILLRSQVADQKTIIDKCTGETFPVFTLIHMDVINNDLSGVSFQQI